MNYTITYKGERIMNNNNNIDDLKKKLDQIKKMGWVASKRNGPTGIGYTFESLLGRDENNLPYYDYEDIEIKVHRKNSSSPIHLFNATPDGDELFPIKKLVNKIGYPDKKNPEYKVFNVTITGKKYTTLGYYKRLKIKVNYFKKKVDLRVINNMNEKYNLNISWSYDLLKERINCKIKQLAIINADVKVINGKEYFKYESINFYKIKGFNHLIKLIDEGIINVTFKIGVFRDGPRKGQIHDRGTDFSIKQDNLEMLYDLIPSGKQVKIFHNISSWFDSKGIKKSN